MTSADTPLLIALAPLLVASGFFSGTETALFGLQESDRARLRALGGIGARATTALLVNPRALLVTVLLANMTINVLIFVLISVLTLRADGTIEKTALSVGGLLAVVLGGEVLPKITATGRRVAWCRALAPVMLAVHRALSPVRRPLLVVVIDPLARLIRPNQGEDLLTIDELEALLRQSAARGAIGVDEAAMLEGVAAIGRFQAKDVMTPRVDVRWIDASAGPGAVRAFTAESQVSRALVCGGSIDGGVIGVVELSRALLESPRRVSEVMRAPVFVPESARLDQMLETLRRAGERLAVIVDEFGAVVGVATLRDVARRILGAGPTEGGESPEIERIGPGVWRASGRLCVRDWEDALASLPEGGPTTLGGVVVARLGRLARVGDSVIVGNITLRVEQAHEGIVDWLSVSLSDRERDDRGGGAV